MLSAPTEQNEKSKNHAQKRSSRICYALFLCFVI